MPGLIQTNKTPKVQDLADYITNIQRTEFPLFTMLPKGTANQTHFETQVDDYGDTDNIDGVASNADATDFKNMAENRAVVDNYMMKMTENVAVDDFSENVDSNPALAAGEYAEATRKGIVRLKMRVEKLLYSQAEAQKQEAGKTYRTCAIGGFIKSTAPSGSQSVPAIARPAAAQIYADTLANFGEESLQNIMKEIFEATNGQGKFTVPSGSDLKQKISLWAIHRPNVSGSTIVRHFDKTDSTTLDTTVDVISGDFGTAALIPTTRMRYFDGTPAATSAALRRGSGLILDLSKWELVFKRKPTHRTIENKGGGPRGTIETIFGLRAKCPKANGAIYITG